MGALARSSKRPEIVRQFHCHLHFTDKTARGWHVNTLHAPSRGFGPRERPPPASGNASDKVGPTPPTPEASSERREEGARLQKRMRPPCCGRSRLNSLMFKAVR